MSEKQPNQKVRKRLKQTFLQRRHTYRWLINTWKGAQHCSLLEKYKSKVQWDITSHQSEWPSSKSLQTINAGEGVEKREHSYTVDVNVNWYSHYERRYGDYFKKNEIRPPYDPAIPFLGIYPKETKILKDTCTPTVHCGTIYNS